MPTNPFKAPRPSSGSSSSKPTSTSKSADFNSSKSTFSSANKVTKSKPARKHTSETITANGKRKDKAKAAPRQSYQLPSLSPDSDVEIEGRSLVEEQDEEQDENEDQEDEESGAGEEEEEEGCSESSSSRQKSTSKSQSATRRRRSGTLDHQSSQQLDYDVENDVDAQPQDRTIIPTNLLTVILQTHFAEYSQGQGKGKSGTRISKEAARAVGKYLDTFVREAVARAEWMDREGGVGGDGFGGRGDGGGSGVLEVEVLERLGPQLLLDF